MVDRESPEKSISEADFRRAWGELTHNQRRFAVAMLDSKSKKGAALAIGIEPDTCYRWNGAIDDAIAYMMANARNAAFEILEDSAVKAAMIKRGGLDSEDEDTRHRASTEVLDRILGKPTQRTEHTGADGGPIKIDDDRVNQALAILHTTGDCGDCRCKTT